VLYVHDKNHAYTRARALAQHTPSVVCIMCARAMTYIFNRGNRLNGTMSLLTFRKILSNVAWCVTTVEKSNANRILITDHYFSRSTRQYARWPRSKVRRPLNVNEWSRDEPGERNLICRHPFATRERRDRLRRVLPGRPRGMPGEIRSCDLRPPSALTSADPTRTRPTPGPRATPIHRLRG